MVASDRRAPQRQHSADALPARLHWLVVVTYIVGVGELVNVTVSQPTIYFFPAWIALVSIVLLVRRPPRGFALEASPRE